jgi:SAM-dependent methyltransferase
VVLHRYYASVSPRLDREGMAELRTELLGPLSGAIVEIGAGNGRHFSRYPAAVTSVTAVEPEPHLRALAVQAAEHASVPVRVRAGLAERLPLSERCADAAVLCLVMCSLPDRPAASAEVLRVLRPGGVLRFLEHTIAAAPGLRAVQKLADATIWPWFTGGCHTATDPLGALRQAGFDVEELRRLRFPATRFTQPSSPHVLGTARAPR